MKTIAASPVSETLRQLKQFIAFPTVSSDPRQKQAMQDCASWLKRRLREIGMHRAAVFPTSTHPLVYGEYLPDRSLPTILFYGHYDVQPVEPLEAWATPPFEAVVRGDHIYGRGTSDDKGQLLTHIAGIAALLRSGRPMPVNVKFLIEGAEEIGSEGLKEFILSHQSLLQCDAFFVSDTTMASLDTPAITYSLRGSLNVELSIRTLPNDLHSGTFGGRAPNAAHVLSRFLAGLHRPDQTIAIPGFYKEVAESTPGMSPALAVTTITAGHQGKGVKSVIPATATTKLNLRLVPHQRPENIRALLDRYIREKLASAKPAVRYSAAASPVVVSRDNPYIRAAVKACESVFGRKPVFVRSGGTIGAVDWLHSHLKAPAVLLGFAQKSDNRHGPNEKLYLPNFERGIQTIIQFVQNIPT
jgi:acetylornithine deacetylase/succinyl-diaminopimelate desuccinylase-like protein